jgi:hypothetical protein
MPPLNFEVKNIVLCGRLWDTIIAVQLVDRASPADGSRTSKGVHIIKLRWGEAVPVHDYLDTQKVYAHCHGLAALGREEASAPPIDE